VAVTDEAVFLLSKSRSGCRRRPLLEMENRGNAFFEETIRIGRIRSLGIGGFYLIPRKRRQAKKQLSGRIGRSHQRNHRVVPPFRGDRSGYV
jgi:hypothetical protein